MRIYTKLPKVLQRALDITFQNYITATIITFILFVFIPRWITWCLLYLGGFLLVCNIVASLLNEWRPRKYETTYGKAVFITGCDSGFGHGLAKRLDKLGLQVFAGCLLPDGEGAQSLRKSGSENLHVVPLDVTSKESAENAINYVKKHIGNNKFWALVNNAGINNGGELMFTKLDIIKSIADVNLYGVVRMTQSFITLLARDKGRVVTVVSASHRLEVPMMIPYAMSKSGVMFFCNGLRTELYRMGVKVITIEPGTYPTPFMDKQTILRYISKTWDECPEDIKELYPKDFSDHFEAAIGTLYKQTGIGSKNPEEVVNCLEEAVMALDPKYSYFPATTYVKAGCWILRKLPKPVSDALVYSNYIC